MKDFFAKASEVLSSIQNGLGNVLTIILFFIFLCMFIGDFIGIIKLAKMVFNVYRSSEKDKIIRHIDCLLKMKGELISKITQFEYMNTWYEARAKSIIKKYTAKTDKEIEYGIISKRKTTYYTDLQKACVESNEQLEILAVALSLYITQHINLYDQKKQYIIAGQSSGNILLANRVASILGLPFIIIGNLAGKEEAIFGDFKKNEEPIIVDDVLFTGTMLVKNLKILEDKGLICKKIYVVVRRSLAYEECLAQYKNTVQVDIQSDSLYTFLDSDFEAQF